MVFRWTRVVLGPLRGLGITMPRRQSRIRIRTQILQILFSSSNVSNSNNPHLLVNSCTKHVVASLKILLAQFSPLICSRLQQDTRLSLIKASPHIQIRRQPGLRLQVIGWGNPSKIMRLSIAVTSSKSRWSLQPAAWQGRHSQSLEEMPHLRNVFRRVLLPVPRYLLSLVVRRQLFPRV